MQPKLLGPVTITGILLLASAARAQVSWAPGEPTYYSTPYFFYQSDSRGYTGDGDWAPWRFKGECDPAYMATGLSQYEVSGPNYLEYLATGNRRLRVLLCQSKPSGITLMVGSGYPQEYTLDFAGADDRRDTGFGDWAPGYVKGECGLHDVMTGIAQSVQGSEAEGHVLTARCVRMAQGTAGYCYVIPFTFADAGYLSVPYDWDYGYHKSQCAPGDYIKGIARNTNGHARSMLCCSLDSVATLQSQALTIALKTTGSQVASVQQVRSAAQTSFEQFDAKAKQLFQILATVSKSESETASAIVRNIN